MVFLNVSHLWFTLRFFMWGESSIIKSVICCSAPFKITYDTEVIIPIELREPRWKKAYPLHNDENLQAMSKSWTSWMERNIIPPSLMTQPSKPQWSNTTRRPCLVSSILGISWSAYQMYEEKMLGKKILHQTKKNYTNYKQIEEEDPTTSRLSIGNYSKNIKTTKLKLYFN